MKANSLKQRCLALRLNWTSGQGNGVTMGVLVVRCNLPDVFVLMQVCIRKLRQLQAGNFDDFATLHCFPHALY